ncbi:putative histidine kinase [Halobacteriovorax marinus SJ]|uniref:histidine kinase n=1 Tax=Halobacteriovorax marinus (strain ATCC BAA-682 / DSM 15412 / SJ) TaxID=862908 RepID=E1X491_HALMS|nr:HAMP domain-containing sensor histidine kinase [Halobacteriovorax marinus]CBW27063.1 putative histidine kinase [Halobacteriovorax marinus SJ]
MNSIIELDKILSGLDQDMSCASFLERISTSLPFRGVAYVDLPETLPAKVDSRFIYSSGKRLSDIQFFIGDSVRRKIKSTIWTPDNFLIDPKDLDNQEVISRFKIKVLSRVPIYLDCNTILGIIYFAHDEEINEGRYELFAALNAIGAIFSRIFYREFGCELPGAHAQVDLLKKMLDSSHDLISSVIHDLSNPLTVIYFETQKSLSNKERDITKSLTNIENSIDQIYKIIDSTKKFFSKNKEKEDLEVVKIEDVSDFINFQFSAFFLEKNLKFESSAHELEFIAFKSTFFNTVIASIISNSIRYSPEDSTIKIYGVEKSGRVEVVIEDEAGGFPKEVLENLDSNFKSKPSPSTGGDIGSGMGLVLAKSYLQIMNGQLEIETLDKGSRITLKMSK